jgi:mRNA-degrading endonuclease RelE of RelBE toxin-antitoxin system
LLVARVVIRREVIEEGELDLVPTAKLREALRLLEREPERGKPLRRALTGCRSIRIGGSENRLVYRVISVTASSEEIIEILAIERRRESEAYDTAERRL